MDIAHCAEPVHDLLVPVLTPQVHVAAGAQHLQMAAAAVHQAQVERAAAQVEREQRLFLVRVALDPAPTSGSGSLAGRHPG